MNYIYNKAFGAGDMHIAIPITKAKERRPK